MAYFRICDLCKKKIKLDGFSIRVIGPGRFRDADFCKSCWTDKTKWEEIHNLSDKDK